ncbi:TetR/AcrR family transcriptional regulator [Geothrix alkalitolerans]|uniref:TetR/AcrR family transcriptional regulator n=1 Tax=Geothrix alkalitolerans TaxID=2922724 RepID=UPI001FB01F68|nr:TetR/AcrR family transcriptional regulator [Geothrix alkalitolerans]
MGNEKKARVLEAAESVFLRFGYRRTTMGDLAAAAGMSRPALYLVFCNKEEAFEAVLRAFTARTLEEVRQGLEARPTPLEKLRFAFDLWAVRPFGFFEASPELREPLHGGLAFAKGAIDEAVAAFEAELVGILAPLSAGAPAKALPPGQIARVLTRAVHGFKESAKDADELRAMIDGLLEMVLASLQPAPEAGS